MTLPFPVEAWCGNRLKQGEMVSIWTVCAGEPPLGDLSPFAKELHARWELGQNAPAQRRIEDKIPANALEHPTGISPSPIAFIGVIQKPVSLCTPPRQH